MISVAIGQIPTFSVTIASTLMNGLTLFYCEVSTLTFFLFFFYKIQKDPYNLRSRYNTDKFHHKPTSKSHIPMKIHLLLSSPSFYR